MNRIGRLAALLLPALFLLVACDLLDNTPAAYPVATVAPTAVLPTPAATSLPALVPDASRGLLRVWLPAEIGARTTAGAQELADQITTFEAGQSLEVLVEQKPVEGAGGILSYLRTGTTVAPSILPDVIALPAVMLTDPAVRQMLQPLDDLIEPAMLDDAFADAAAQVVSDGRLYGVPFVSAGLTHLVYTRASITDTIPMDWTTFISDTNHSLVLPADSRDGALFGLQFYLAEGGTLVDENGQPDLQPEPLARALRQIASRPENLLQSRQLKTLDEAWQYYQVEQRGFLWVRADYYLGRRAVANATPGAPKLGYSRVPGPGAPLTPLTTTWVWAVATSDPARQGPAVQLIRLLTTPQPLATWAEQSQLLPARREAMALLAAEGEYYRFAREELERARPMPISESSRQLAAIGDAVFQVLTTDQSPEAIAEATVIGLRQ